MNYRYMRIIVFFDLPSITIADQKEYRAFRKYLIKSGFVMMQESVYNKIVPNSTAADSVIASIKRNKPQKGLVQVLRITEKQFSRIEYIVGQKKSGFLNNDDKLIIL